MCSVTHSFVGPCPSPLGGKDILPCAFLAREDYDDVFVMIFLMMTTEPGFVCKNSTHQNIPVLNFSWDKMGVRNGNATKPPRKSRTVGAVPPVGT